MDIHVKKPTVKGTLTAAHTAAAVYGVAAAIVSHAGLWEAVDTWESLGIAAVATAATILTNISGWLTKGGSNPK